MSLALLTTLPAEPKRPTPSRRAFVIGGLATMVGALPRKSFALPASATPESANPVFWLQPRVISVVNADTGQRGVFEYWRDGKYVMDAYYALSALGLDHREHKAVQIDPRVFDVVYATQEWYFMAERRRTFTELTSVYRTPRTNRIVGGSPLSTHIEGKASDGRLVGVRPRVYAAMLRSLNAGGVGLYDNHCHWDVGRAPAFWIGKSKET
jgi:uncharacterized protein YcbK (DUF882 family)